MEPNRHLELKYKNQIHCKEKFAEVILLVYDILYFYNTQLNTFSHCEELKGQKKMKRSPHTVLRVPIYVSLKAIIQLCIVNSSMSQKLKNAISVALGPLFSFSIFVSNPTFFKTFTTLVGTPHITKSTPNQPLAVHATVDVCFVKVSSITTTLPLTFPSCITQTLKQIRQQSIQV